jgi:hypothetical protein
MQFHHPKCLLIEIDCPSGHEINHMDSFIIKKITV